MLRHALKEWAVICRALAEGRQAILLRKGGIEEGGEFHLAHTRFWLYATYVHQQETGINSEARPVLEEVQRQRPQQGVVLLEHFAEVDGIYHVHDVATVLKLRQMHFWSDETAQARFSYRHPGLFVLPVRVYRAAQVTQLSELPTYSGCRSWVDLEQEIPTERATPILSDEIFHEVILELERILQPVAFA
jgi:hypothetical protein